MPTATAVGGSAIATARNSTTPFSLINSFRICRCSLNRTAVPFRAWIVLKEKRSGSRSAWFQRSLMNGGSNTPGDGVLGSPDLLTIPGVGPRNLRKLVNNGIRGVAEHKQIYKDKEDFLFLKLKFQFQRLESL